MIFLAAGTRDGRELAGALLAAGYPVTASVVSRYGEELLAEYPNLRINDCPLDEAGLVNYLRENGVRLFVDASHPYAANVSRNAMRACRALHVPYIRYERPSAPVDYDRVFPVTSYEEAARKAAQLGKNVFLTTGSRNVKAFTESPYLKECVIIARVLPTAEVIAEMTALGLTPKTIVAMQGPFSTELNIALYRQYETDVVVTKNSGRIGGTDTKLEAAKALGLPVVLIGRPNVAYDAMAESFDEVLAFVAGHWPQK